ncbi:aminopeptidase N-like [Glandiceps talaboti]
MVRMETHELEEGLNVDVFTTRKRTVYIAVIVVVLLLAVVALAFFFIPKLSTRSGVCELVTNTTKGEALKLPPIPQPQNIPTPPPPEPFEGRLPESLRPEHYVIWMKIYMDTEDGDRRHSYDGKVNITLKCTKKTKTVRIHSKMLTVDFDSIQIYRLSNLDKLNVGNVGVDEVYDSLIIKSRESLLAGEDYIISINYRGELRSDDLLGFYVSSYSDEGKIRWVALTCFQPTFARKAFPCMDEPHLKATFDIIITHRPNRTALSNMPEYRVTDDGEWRTTYFDTSVPMSTYHISFAILDFERIEKITPTGIQFRVWASPSKIAEASYALEVGVKILSFFEEYFEIRYPIPKMDMVASPDYASAGLENWALIVYLEPYMLYDPATQSPEQKFQVATIIAHELAHMWFGNMVTLDWWDQLWLNEGFATFFEYPAVDHVHPEWQMWDQFLTETIPLAMTVDSQPSKSMVHHVEGWTEEVWALFGSIAYDKGASVVRSFKSFVSEEVMDSGIRDYLTTHLYGSVNTDDLWQALEKADSDHGGTDVKGMMDSWALQAGVPVVMVTRVGRDSVKIQQSQFIEISDGTLQEDLQETHKWNIPLTFTHQAEKEFQRPSTAWLLADNEEDTIKIQGLSNDDWILFNINQTGYYRVNYDVDNWRKLAEALKENYMIFPTQTRAALLNDAFTLALAGHIEMVYALQLTEYLHQETEYIVWELLKQHLPKLHVFLLKSPEFELFEKYWRNKIAPLYSSLGWNLTTNDLLEYRKRLHAIKVSCVYGNKHCLKTSHRLYRNWMKDPQNKSLVSISALAPVLYCAAIRKGDVQDWMFAHRELTNDYFYDVTMAMGCTRESWLLQGHLEMYHKENRTYNAIRHMVQKSELGFSVAWKFFMERFDELLQKDESAYDYLVEFLPVMNTESDLNQIMEFGSRYNDMPTRHATEFYTAIEKVKSNIARMDTNRDGITQWLVDVTRDMPNDPPYSGKEIYLSEIMSKPRRQKREVGRARRSIPRDSHTFSKEQIQTFRQLVDRSEGRQSAHFKV